MRAKRPGRHNRGENDSGANGIRRETTRYRTITGARSYIFRYVLKRRRDDTFLGTLFRFKNGVVFVLPIKLMQISMFFADWLVYSGITLVFKFQAVWTTSYHTQFRFILTRITLLPLSALSLDVATSRITRIIQSLYYAPAGRSSDSADRGRSIIRVTSGSVI